MHRLSACVQRRSTCSSARRSVVSGSNVPGTTAPGAHSSPISSSCGRGRGVENATHRSGNATEVPCAPGTSSCDSTLVGRGQALPAGRASWGPRWRAAPGQKCPPRCPLPARSGDSQSGDPPPPPALGRFCTAARRDGIWVVGRSQAKGYSGWRAASDTGRRGGTATSARQPTRGCAAHLGINGCHHKLDKVDLGDCPRGASAVAHGAAQRGVGGVDGDETRGGRAWEAGGRGGVETAAAGATPHADTGRFDQDCWPGEQLVCATCN